MARRTDCTLALVVQRHGEVVFERYGHQPDTLFGPGGPVTADTTLISWSMAKSITHAAVGIPSATGRCTLDAPAPGAVVAGDRRRRRSPCIDLLEMRPGLEFVEDYVDDSVSHCLEMLYGDGQGRHGRLRRGAAAAARARHGVELLQRHHQHRVPHRRRLPIGWRQRRGRDGGVPARSAVRADRHALGAIPKFDDRRHLRRLVATCTRPPATSPGSGELYLDDGVVATARGCCRPAGATRPHPDHVRRPRRRVRLRRPLVAVARLPRHASRATATRASTPWWFPTATWSWSTSARCRPRADRRSRGAGLDRLSSTPSEGVPGSSQRGHGDRARRVAVRGAPRHRLAKRGGHRSSRWDRAPANCPASRSTTPVVRRARAGSAGSGSP